MILMIDNYDSFTYNLYQYIGALTPDVQVVRNDKITVDEIAELAPSHIILSPGPGYPKDAGICIPLIQRFSGKIPILGVCLGHQSIGEAFGGKIVHAPRIMHGKGDIADIVSETPLFAGMGDRLEVGRYHSLVIEPKSVPEELKVTAVTKDGCIMAVEHKTAPTYGVQFHPESVLTPNGMTVIENFLKVRSV